MSWDLSWDVSGELFNIFAIQSEGRTAALSIYMHLMETLKMHALVCFFTGNFQLLAQRVVCLKPENGI